jgi:hypothetical protein
MIQCVNGNNKNHRDDTHGSPQQHHVIAAVDDGDPESCPDDHDNLQASLFGRLEVPQKHQDDRHAHPNEGRFVRVECRNAHPDFHHERHPRNIDIHGPKECQQTQSNRNPSILVGHFPFSFSFFSSSEKKK